MLPYRARLFLQRLIYAIRPPARTTRLSIDDVLRSQHAMSIVEQFNDLSFRASIAGPLMWRGVPVIKNPCDLWVMIELLQELRPTAIVETGTHHGGSALFYADVSRTLGIDTTVVTVDVNPKWSFDPATKGIVSIVGVTTTRGVVEQVRRAVEQARTRRSGAVVVVLDSDHTEENVFRELTLYAPLVTVGSYVVVEDTNVNGHPSSPEFGPGPYEATQRFLATDANFAADRSRERHLLTFNPGGWLRRIS